MTPYKAYAVSWNLTQRCNLFCAHCYISGAPSASAAGELTTEECRRVMADMARVNPGTFLILTGGEPLLRPDIFELAAEGREHGFTVVLGTNGVLLRAKQARLMKTHGVQGASLSLDSVDAARHDAFRHLPGAWKGAIRAAEALASPVPAGRGSKRHGRGQTPVVAVTATRCGGGGASARRSRSRRGTRVPTWLGSVFDTARADDARDTSAVKRTSENGARRSHSRPAPTVRRRRRARLPRRASPAGTARRG